MSFSGKFDRRRGWLKVTLLIGAVAVFAVVLLAGCGGSDDTTGGSEETAAAETEEATSEAAEEGGSEEEASGETTVSADELQKTVNQALETEDIKADSLPPLMI